MKVWKGSKAILSYIKEVQSSATIRELHILHDFPVFSIRITLLTLTQVLTLQSKLGDTLYMYVLILPCIAS